MAFRDDHHEQLQRTVRALQGQLSAALQELSWQTLKIQSLEEKLRQARIARASGPAARI